MYQISHNGGLYPALLVIPFPVGLRTLIYEHVNVHKQSICQRAFFSLSAQLLSKFQQTLSSTMQKAVTLSV